MVLLSRLCAICLLAFVAVNAFAQDAAEVRVPLARDLQADAKLSRSGRLPILLVFSADYCPYCQILEEEFIRPMLISGDYEDRVIIRVLKLDSEDLLRDFNGDTVSAGEFADRHGIRLTPTLKFFDGQGRELVPEMVGLYTVDFYGGYLDETIDASLAKLRTGPDPDI